MGNPLRHTGHQTSTQLRAVPMHTCWLLAADVWRGWRTQRGHSEATARGAPQPRGTTHTRARAKRQVRFTVKSPHINVAASALRVQEPNRSALQQTRGGCRDRSEFKNRTERLPPRELHTCGRRPRRRARGAGVGRGGWRVRGLRGATPDRDSPPNRCALTCDTSCAATYQC